MAPSMATNSPEDTQPTLDEILNEYSQFSPEAISSSIYAGFLFIPQLLYHIPQLSLFFH
jgi:hypothetical protein